MNKEYAQKQLREALEDTLDGRYEFKHFNDLFTQYIHEHCTKYGIPNLDNFAHNIRSEYVDRNLAVQEKEKEKELKKYRARTQKERKRLENIALVRDMEAKK